MSRFCFLIFTLDVFVWCKSSLDNNNNSLKYTYNRINIIIFMYMYEILFYFIITSTLIENNVLYYILK